MCCKKKMSSIFLERLRFINWLEIRLVVRALLNYCIALHPCIAVHDFGNNLNGTNFNLQHFDLIATRIEFWGAFSDSHERYLGGRAYFAAPVEQN